MSIHMSIHMPMYMSTQICTVGFKYIMKAANATCMIAADFATKMVMMASGLCDPASKVLPDDIQAPAAKACVTVLDVLSKVPMAPNL